MAAYYGNGKLKALAMNTAACARVSDALTQKLPPPQPEVIPSWAILSTNPANGCPGGTSLNNPVGEATGVSPIALIVNTAICPRVTGSLGQKLPLPHPAVIPRPAIRSINPAPNDVELTSPNIPLGGTSSKPSALVKKMAACALVTGASGQKLTELAEHPVVIPALNIPSMNRKAKWLALSIWRVRR